MCLIVCVPIPQQRGGLGPIGAVAPQKKKSTHLRVLNGKNNGNPVSIGLTTPRFEPTTSKQLGSVI